MDGCSRQNPAYRLATERAPERGPFYLPADRTFITGGRTGRKGGLSGVPSDWRSDRPETECARAAGAGANGVRRQREASGEIRRASSVTRAAATGACRAGRSRLVGWRAWLRRLARAALSANRRRHERDAAGDAAGRQPDVAAPCPRAEGWPRRTSLQGVAAEALAARRGRERAWVISGGNSAPCSAVGTTCDVAHECARPRAERAWGCEPRQPGARAPRAQSVLSGDRARAGRDRGD